MCGSKRRQIQNVGDTDVGQVVSAIDTAKMRGVNGGIRQWADSHS